VSEESGMSLINWDSSRWGNGSSGAIWRKCNVPTYQDMKISSLR
jgi:hypothetical protein